MREADRNNKSQADNYGAEPFAKTQKEALLVAAAALLGMLLYLAIHMVF
jgi:hypothetical protein